MPLMAKRNTETAASLTRPSASIVVATHARPQFLADCLASIAAAMAEGDELVVMDCCTSEAAGILTRLAVPVTHVSGPHASKTGKLNAAIRSVRNEVIVVTDDDCRVSPGWVDAMARPFSNPAVGVAFGPVVGLSSAPGGSPAPVLPAGPAPPELWNYAHGAAMAVRSSAVADVGGFDERLGPGAGDYGEEADLVLRLAARGWTCQLADAPPVRHLEWRDREETRRNFSVYQRGSGVYLGAGLRRHPGRTVKPFVLRVRHELGMWRDRHARGWSFGPRMTLAFAGGLLRGVALPPRRFLDQPEATRATGARPRVLWVTDEPPDRLQGGGNIRQAMLLGSLRDRLDVTLLLVGHLSDAMTRRHVSAVLELPRPRTRPPRRLTQRRIHDLWRVIAQRRPSEVTGAARVHRTLRPVLKRVANDFDVVVVLHLSLAPVLPAHRRARWLLEMQNVPSERARQELADERGRRQRWLLSREAANARRYEGQVVASYDGLVVVSDQDAASLAGERGERALGPVIVVPNGVDTSALTATPLPREPNILLPATLNYRPNVLGAIWFCDEILALVQSKVPGVRFDLVGRQPVPEVVALARRPGVHVHADVSQMAPWLAQARVVVVPLRMGTGTRLKALEAMAAGRPVVGTSIGLEGLGVVDGEQARVVDEPAAMADAIAELLISDTAAETLATAGRRLVEERFRWDALGNRLGDALEAIANRVS
jgi:polysaccharide biosynthesis protein PslH